jgi:hypothetical protein
VSDLELPGNGDKRGYSWPPFEPGNDAALTAGHRSPERVGPIAQHLAEQIVKLPNLEYLAEPRFGAAVLAWARSEAVVMLLTNWIARMSTEEATTPPSKRSQTEPFELLRRYESAAATHRARLGLDPMSAAKLQRELVEMSATARYAGLDRVREQGAAARERRRMTAIDVPSDDDGGGDAA